LSYVSCVPVERGVECRSSACSGRQSKIRVISAAFELTTEAGPPNDFVRSPLP
jgi:hypothetical protein